MDQVKISVLTPSYNRADKLKVLYQSLCNQNYINFEWIIIADGSTDETDAVVKGFIEEKKLQIKYKWKKNGGKPSAHNEGVLLADSELIVICDDDDYFTNGALSTINKYWAKYKKDEVGGLIAYKGGGNDSSTTVGNKVFPSDKIYAHLDDIFVNNKYFDTVQIYRTAVLKNNLFPVIKNEKFVPEIYIWRKLDKNYCIIIVPEILEIVKYLDDGMTKSGRYNILNNPIGYSYYFNQKAELTYGLKKYVYHGIVRALVRLANRKMEDFSFVICKNPISLFTAFIFRIKIRGKKNGF